MHKHGINTPAKVRSTQITLIASILFYGMKWEGDGIYREKKKVDEGKEIQIRWKKDYQKHDE